MQLTDKWSIPYEFYPTSVMERIKKKSVRAGNGCLEYGGGKLRHKYGLVGITMKRLVGGVIETRRIVVPAHRAMWMAAKGRFDLPRSVYILHSCDSSCCVDMGHLREGVVAKKHCLHTRQRKFTNEQIAAIKAAHGNLKCIAEKFGTTAGYVSKLRNGKAKTLIAPGNPTQ